MNSQQHLRSQGAFVSPAALGLHTLDATEYQMPPTLFKALSAQVAGLILVYGLARNGIFPALPLVMLAGIQGIFAAIVSALLISPRWWQIIHLIFLPAIVASVQLELPIEFYATGFFILLLTYWTSFRTQVPLFLSNRITVHRLAQHLPDRQALKVLDVGSGTGSFAVPLAKLRPDWTITGIETAPAPLWMSRYLGRKLKNLLLLRTDFWPHSLSDYDFVYAFLSPAPMPALWRKARKEMRSGSILISNSFGIPGVKPDKILEIDDSRQTQLLLYYIP
jgi:hypothetical protein